ncbi:MAG: hypothetical protein HRT66_09630 [Flavobacteriaceae bacterium]|nr:hypothetical protein [Flavobacteriaceae bacterium]
MKKALLLITLFILPLGLYLFLSSGVNSFGKLPVLKTEIVDPITFTENTKQIGFKDKITVLVFVGSDIENNKIAIMNLNQKIYKHFNNFDDFRILLVSDKESEGEITALMTQINTATGTDMANWNSIFLNDDSTKTLFDSLESPYLLDENNYSPYVYIIDKRARLRGRNDDQDIEGGILHGYNMESVSTLNNKMVDDVKIVLAEYRLELKKRGKMHRDI